MIAELVKGADLVAQLKLEAAKVVVGGFQASQ
jgi:hypothetical protein